jgi:hypothetical protein
MQFYENKTNSSIFKETSKIQSKYYTKFKGTRLELKNKLQTSRSHKGIKKSKDN